MSGSTEQALACGLVCVHLQSSVIGGLLSVASFCKRGCTMHEAVEAEPFLCTPQYLGAAVINLLNSIDLNLFKVGLSLPAGK